MFIKYGKSSRATFGTCHIWYVRKRDFVLDTPALKALCTKVPGNPTVFAILFTFVTKLQKLGLRWFDGTDEEKKRITSDAISHR